MNGVMFVESELPVALPFSLAVTALERAVADGGLVVESRRAVEGGLAFVMPVGPRGSQGPAKDVLVQLLPGRNLANGVVVPLRWEVADLTERLFPALDANLELFPVSDNTSRLSIIGRYDPPLGLFGAVIDRAAMSKVASATMAGLLREVAVQLGRWADDLGGCNEAGGA